MNNMKFYIIITLIFLNFACSSGKLTKNPISQISPVSNIPYGQPPILNGLNNDNEWNDRNCFTKTVSDIKVSIFQDSLYLYIALTDKESNHTGIDLYLDNLSDPIKMLHISSAQATRELKNKEWVDLKWGGQVFWTSNLSQSYISGGEKIFELTPMYEFQIRKSFFKKNSFKLNCNFKRPDKWLIKPGDNISSKNWLEIKF